VTDIDATGVLRLYDDMINWAAEQRDKADKEHMMQARSRDRPDTDLSVSLHDKHFYRGVKRAFELAKQQLEDTMRRAYDLEALFKERADEE